MTVPGDRMIDVTWLGHSTVVLDMDGVRILTDPLLRPHAGLLRRIGAVPDPERWRRPDAVLVSHLHHDHAELRSLRLVSGTPVMSAATNVAWLEKQGVPCTTALGEGWVRLAGEVEVRQVRADHRHRPMPHRPNEAHGQLVRGPSGRVWVAGDTSLHAEMSALPDRAGGSLDLAIVPIWGWGPRLSPGHMTPDEAAVAVSRSGARFATPVHWGTLHPPLVTRFARDWLDLPGERFADALGRHAPGCVPIVLEPGESCSLPSARHAPDA